MFIYILLITLWFRAKAYLQRGQVRVEYLSQADLSAVQAEEILIFSKPVSNFFIELKRLSKESSRTCKARLLKSSSKGFWLRSNVFFRARKWLCFCRRWKNRVRCKRNRWLSRISWISRSGRTSKFVFYFM